MYWKTFLIYFLLIEALSIKFCVILSCLMYVLVMKGYFDINNKLSSAKAFDYPFKHIVIENFLPEELYLQAEGIYSDDFFIKKFGDLKNKGSNVAASFNLLSDPEIIEYGLENYNETFQMLKFFKTKELHKTLYKLFGDSLIEIYKNGTNFKNFSSDYYPLLNMDENGNNEFGSESDLSIDTSIKCAINTPSFGNPKSVRDIHIDNPVKLFNSLIYFRLKEDDYSGGDLILYRFKRNKIKLHNRVYASHKDCKISKVIPYKRNTLVLFINSLNSLHGVVERANVPLVRRYINISGSFRFNQFEVSKYQDKKKNLLNQIDGIKKKFDKRIFLSNKN